MYNKALTKQKVFLFMFNLVVMFGEVNSEVITKTFRDNEVSKFSLKTTQFYEAKEYHSFNYISAWNKLSNIAKDLNQGDMVLVTGIVKTNKSETTGQNYTEIKANSINKLQQTYCNSMQPIKEEDDIPF